MKSTTNVLESISLFDRLNAVKFLENIVLDYVKFQPIDLYGMVLEPMLDIKHKIQRKIDQINLQKKSTQQKKERAEQQIEASRNLAAAQEIYEEKKAGMSVGAKIATTTATTTVGGLVGGGVVLATMAEGAAFGTVGGPVGLAIGAGIGLLVGESLLSLPEYVYWEISHHI